MITETTRSKEISPPSLRSVLQDFIQWRGSPNKAYRIPGSLWNKVFQLLPDYPLSKILVTLGISTAQFKKRQAKRTDTMAKTMRHSPCEASSAIEAQRTPSTFIKAQLVAQKPCINASSHNKTRRHID